MGEIVQAESVREAIAVCEVSSARANEFERIELREIKVAFSGDFLDSRWSPKWSCGRTSGDACTKVRGFRLFGTEPVG